MCQATVYLGEQEIARDVAWLEQVCGSVHLVTLFGEEATVAGRIHSIDLLKHRVWIDPPEGDEDGRQG